MSTTLWTIDHCQWPLRCVRDSRTIVRNVMAEQNPTNRAVHPSAADLIRREMVAAAGMTQAAVTMTEPIRAVVIDFERPG